MAVTDIDIKERNHDLLKILKRIADMYKVSGENKTVILPVSEKIGKKTFTDYEICRNGFLGRNVPLLRARWLYSSGNCEEGPYTTLLIAHREEELPKKTIVGFFEEKFSARSIKPVYVKFVDYKEAKKRNFTD
jgi:hypothetical protein